MYTYICLIFFLFDCKNDFRNCISRSEYNLYSDWYIYITIGLYIRKIDFSPTCQYVFSILTFSVIFQCRLSAYAQNSSHYCITISQSLNRIVFHQNIGSKIFVSDTFSCKRFDFSPVCFSFKEAAILKFAGTRKIQTEQ